MAKRKTFYVPAAIFEGEHSAYAVAVYAYLCFCADKDGVCFPGKETIAARTGMSRNTVQKAVSELKRAGLIRTEETHTLSKNGRMRQSVNRYRLCDAPSQKGGADCHEVTTASSRRDPLPRHVVTPPPSCRGREINNNSKEITGDVPSVGMNAREDTTGLDAILASLHLETFFDRVFAESVRQTVASMYRMPRLSVNGIDVGNAAIRDRLRMLTVDHIDYVERRLNEHAGEVVRGERYLMACLYNAPVDCMVKNAADRFG